MRIWNERVSFFVKSYQMIHAYIVYIAVLILWKR